MPLCKCGCGNVCGNKYVNGHTWIGRHHTKETKKKIRNSNLGKVSEFKGKHHTNEVRKIISERTKRAESTPEFRKKLSSSAKKRVKRMGIPFKGMKHSKESKRKMRLSAIRRIQNKKFGGHQWYPTYNPIACQRIDEYGKKHGFVFQHAENGGEFYIPELGYWVDGYDKEKNIVVEYYEPKHQYQKEKDELRKREIVKCLGCKFIEIWER